MDPAFVTKLLAATWDTAHAAGRLQATRDASRVLLRAIDHASSPGAADKRVRFELETVRRKIERLTTEEIEADYSNDITRKISLEESAANEASERAAVRVRGRKGGR